MLIVVGLFIVCVCVVCCVLFVVLCCSLLFFVGQVQRFKLSSRSCSSGGTPSQSLGPVDQTARVFHHHVSGLDVEKSPATVGGAAERNASAPPHS